MAGWQTKVCRLCFYADKNTALNKQSGYFSSYSVLFIAETFVIEHTVTIALKFGILYLLPELLANALVVFDFFESARAVSAGSFKTFLDFVYKLGIFVKANLH